jgi:hypothetical protein
MQLNKQTYHDSPNLCLAHLLGPGLNIHHYLLVKQVILKRKSAFINTLSSSHNIIQYILNPYLDSFHIHLDSYHIHLDSSHIHPCPNSALSLYHDPVLGHMNLEIKSRRHVKFHTEDSIEEKLKQKLSWPREKEIKESKQFMKIIHLSLASPS